MHSKHTHLHTHTQTKLLWLWCRLPLCCLGSVRLLCIAVMTQNNSSTDRPTHTAPPTHTVHSCMRLISIHTNADTHPWIQRLFLLCKLWRQSHGQQTRWEKSKKTQTWQCSFDTKTLETPQEKTTNCSQGFGVAIHSKYELIFTVQMVAEEGWHLCGLKFMTS